MPAFGRLQTHACAAAQLIGTHRRDIDEKKSTSNRRREFGANGRRVFVVGRKLVSHRTSLSRSR
jgi:hypothetical protein